MKYFDKKSMVWDSERASRGSLLRTSGMLVVVAALLGLVAPNTWIVWAFRLALLLAAGILLVLGLRSRSK
jgi:hypothetical protein